jgi:hypothetical protein
MQKRPNRAKNPVFFRSRVFQMEWNNTFASFNKEQIKNYEYQLECLEQDYPVEFYRQIQIKSLQKKSYFESKLQEIQ